MIDFTRAFDSAWERMMIILFRPFDLGKWCVIGFGAFLAGLIAGGNGFNTSYRQNYNAQGAGSSSGAPLQQFEAGMSHFMAGIQTGLIIAIATAIIGIVFALILLLYWLGARGQFIFLDNIVRNRAAIAGPWKYYARPGNQVFVLHLIFLAVAFGVVLVFIVPGLILAYPLIVHREWPAGATLVGLVILGLLYLGTFLALGSVIFLFREWGIPLMFRNGVSARAAFFEVLGLAQRHPGPTVLFILLRAALWIALVVVSILACCFTCCLAMVPYVGTVVLLPALIYIRCFSLDCLAQFGPAYDIWTVDVPPEQLPPAAPFTPPPPPG
jgi:hypothetical protein